MLLEPAHHARDALVQGRETELAIRGSQALIVCRFARLAVRAVARREVPAERSGFPAAELERTG